MPDRHPPPPDLTAGERETRTVESLTRLERNWLKRRYCGFCDVSCLSSICGAHTGEHELPVIEGVRDKPEIVDLGPPCNMDERRAAWLEFYKPRGAKP